MGEQARRTLPLLLLFVAFAFAASASAATLASGTLLEGRVQQDLNSKTAHDGDPFTVRTEKGSTIYGHLSEVARADAGRKAHLKLNFDRIRFLDGSSQPIEAKLISVSKQSQGYVRAVSTLGFTADSAIGSVDGSLLAISDIHISQYARVELQLTDTLQAP